MGAAAAQLPEPQLPPLSGARVYTDPTQDATRGDDRWLHGTRTRGFAIVPNHGGTLAIPAITLNWWNVASDRPEQASLPAQILTVIGGSTAAGNTPPTAASSTAAPAAVVADRSAGTNSFWRNLALASFALWLIALAVLAWWRVGAPCGFARCRRFAARRRVRPTRVAASAHAGSRAARRCGCLRTRVAGLGAQPNIPDCVHSDALHDALSDPAQRAAFEQLQRAHWKGGDARAACDAIAQAFGRGFRWREPEGASARPARNDLPPLYPSSRTSGD